MNSLQTSDHNYVNADKESNVITMDSPDISIVQRLKNVCEAWEQVNQYGKEADLSYAQALLNTTVRLTFSRLWKTIEVSDRLVLRDVLFGIRIHCWACHALACLLPDPWGNGNNLEKWSTADYRSKMKRKMTHKCDSSCASTPRNILRARVELLCYCGFRNLALQLCLSYRQCLSHKDDFFYADKAFHLLFNSGNVKRMVEEMQCLSCHDGLQLIQFILDNEGSAGHALVECLTQILLVRDLLGPSLYCCTLSLMKTWCWLHYQQKSHLQVVEKEAGKLGALSVTSAHLYLLVDVLYNQYGKQFLPLYLRLYVHALTIDINNLEYARQVNCQLSIAELETNMAGVYTKLTSLLDSDSGAGLARECLLTAFSLEPTLERLNELEQRQPLTPSVWKYNKTFIVPCKGECVCLDKGACQENELPPWYMTDVPNGILDSSLPGVSVALLQDLCVLVEGPRCHWLTWNKPWTELHGLCNHYYLSARKLRFGNDDRKFGIDARMKRFGLLETKELAPPPSSGADKMTENVKKEPEDVHNLINLSNEYPVLHIEEKTKQFSDNSSFANPGFFLLKDLERPNENNGGTTIETPKPKSTGFLSKNLCSNDKFPPITRRIGMLPYKKSDSWTSRLKEAQNAKVSSATKEDSSRTKPVDNKLSSITAANPYLSSLLASDSSSSSLSTFPLHLLDDVNTSNSASDHKTFPKRKFFKGLSDTKSNKCEQLKVGQIKLEPSRMMKVLPHANDNQSVSSTQKPNLAGDGVNVFQRSVASSPFAHRNSTLAVTSSGPNFVHIGRMEVSKIHLSSHLHLTEPSPSNNSFLNNHVNHSKVNTCLPVANTNGIGSGVKFTETNRKVPSNSGSPEAQVKPEEVRDPTNVSSSPVLPVNFPKIGDSPTTGESVEDSSVVAKSNNETNNQNMNVVKAEPSTTGAQQCFGIQKDTDVQQINNILKTVQLKCNLTPSTLGISANNRQLPKVSGPYKSLRTYRKKPTDQSQPKEITWTSAQNNDGYRQMDMKTLADDTNFCGDNTNSSLNLNGLISSNVFCPPLSTEKQLVTQQSSFISEMLEIPIVKKCSPDILNNATVGNFTILSSQLSRPSINAVKDYSPVQTLTADEPVSTSTVEQSTWAHVQTVETPPSLTSTPNSLPYPTILATSGKVPRTNRVHLSKTIPLSTAHFNNNVKPWTPMGGRNGDLSSSTHDEPASFQTTIPCPLAKKQRTPKTTKNGSNVKVHIRKSKLNLNNILHTNYAAQKILPKLQFVQNPAVSSSLLLSALSTTVADNDRVPTSALDNLTPTSTYLQLNNATQTLISKITPPESNCNSENLTDKSSTLNVLAPSIIEHSGTLLSTQSDELGTASHFNHFQSEDSTKTKLVNSACLGVKTPSNPLASTFIPNVSSLTKNKSGFKVSKTVVQRKRVRNNFGKNSKFNDVNSQFPTSDQTFVSEKRKKSLVNDGDYFYSNSLTKVPQKKKVPKNGLGASFVCDVCMKSLSSKNNLDRHKKIHLRKVETKLKEVSETEKEKLSKLIKVATVKIDHPLTFDGSTNLMDQINAQDVLKMKLEQVQNSPTVVEVSRSNKVDCPSPSKCIKLDNSAKELLLKNCFVQLVRQEFPKSYLSTETVNKTPGSDFKEGAKVYEISNLNVDLESKSDESKVTDVESTEDKNEEIERLSEHHMDQVKSDFHTNDDICDKSEDCPVPIDNLDQNIEENCTEEPKQSPEITENKVDVSMTEEYDDEQGTATSEELSEFVSVSKVSFDINAMYFGMENQDIMTIALEPGMTPVISQTFHNELSNSKQIVLDESLESKLVIVPQDLVESKSASTKVLVRGRSGSKRTVKPPQKRCCHCCENVTSSPTQSPKKCRSENTVSSKNTCKISRRSRGGGGNVGRNNSSA